MAPEIYPHGATLADIPPQFRGVTAARYEEILWAKWRVEAEERRRNEEVGLVQKPKRGKCLTAMRG